VDQCTANADQGTVRNFLKLIREKGVSLSAVDGQLHFEAPEDVLSELDKQLLRAYRNEIIGVLEGRSGAISKSECSLRSSHRRYPLAFSQLAHWWRYRLRERAAIRQIASATRLHGPLDVALLIRSISLVACRHDALRARIVRIEPEPEQEVIESQEPEVRVGDLSPMPQTIREREVLRIIDQLIMAPIDVAVGPLWAVHLLKLSDTEHVLVVAMEHIISDDASMNILLDEIFAQYGIEMCPGSNPLPEVSLNFPEHARLQRMSQWEWSNRHEAFLASRLKDCGRVRFPQEMSSPGDSANGWSSVSFRIGKDVKRKLIDRSRSRGTTAAMIVFTAFAALVLRWCECSRGVIRYQIDGRKSPKFERSIGYYSSTLYLLIEVGEEDGFIGFLDRVTEEYANAYDRADWSYIAAQPEPPDFTHNAAFNWIPLRSSEQYPEIALPRHVPRRHPVSFVHPMLKVSSTDSEPIALFYERERDIDGSILYPMSRISRRSMERFAMNLRKFIDALLYEQDGRVQDVVLI
jgi:hypothetical protein